MINQGSEELVLPPGFRFHPTDDELVNHYLCRKCSSQPLAVPIIKEIDLYKYNPWELPEMTLYGEKEWYFFSPRDRKYPNGSRPNRAAGAGYWKATGADKPIGKPNPLGIKKALVFYAGKAPKGVKTNWIMHEYRLANVDRSASVGKKNNSRLDEWVLCRIYNKKGRIEKHFPAAEEIVKDEKLVISSTLLSHPSPDSGSMPKLHTETSWSEDAHSPEVQSDAKWINDLGNSNNNGFDHFDFNFGEEDLFGNEVQQYQMEQDMFMLLDKPYF